MIITQIHRHFSPKNNYDLINHQQYLNQSQNLESFPNFQDFQTSQDNKEMQIQKFEHHNGSKCTERRDPTSYIVTNRINPQAMPRTSTADALSMTQTNRNRDVKHNINDLNYELLNSAEQIKERERFSKLKGVKSSSDL